MCREGAWVELTIEVTSVEDGTTQTARIFLYHFLQHFILLFYFTFHRFLRFAPRLYAIEYKDKQC